MSPRKVVVFDTNVLITLIVSASQSVRLLERLDSAGWDSAVRRLPFLSDRFESAEHRNRGSSRHNKKARERAFDLLGPRVYPDMNVGANTAEKGS
jgi:hypothetical protein